MLDAPTHEARTFCQVSYQESAPGTHRGHLLGIAVWVVTFSVTESYGNDGEARIRDPDNVAKIRMFQAREAVL